MIGTMEEKLYWLGFSVFPGVGSKKFSLLLQTFDSAKKAWEANSDNLENVLGESLTTQFLLFRKTFDLETYAEKIADKKIQFVTLLDKEYPILLKQQQPPFLLYVKGNLSLLNSEKTIAVVGTRNITPYGKEVTQTLTSELVQNNFVIVSGLAFGVDAIAHETTVRQGGKTIAVLGCGVDCCTPLTNQYIYNHILDSGGTIVATFPPGAGASRGSFPARNSTIAGLSLGVLVTEGTHDSGALITAQRAKEYGRPVFAVPGPITSQLSKGANYLLQNGAVAVTNAGDIIKRLGYTSVVTDKGMGWRKEYPHANFSSDELQIIDMLQLEPLHIDQIARNIEKDIKSIGSLLSMMEIKGFIKNNGGVYSL